MIPHNAQGSITKTAEYIASIPKGAQQGQFIGRLLDSVKREKDLADKQIQDYNSKALPGFARLKMLDKKHGTSYYDDNLKSNGLFVGDRTPAAKEESAAPAGEVERATKDGKVAVFDSATKKFLRYK